MRLTLTRTKRWPTATTGTLAIDGVHECYTLEDVVRPPGIKIPGSTAIPAGSYPLRITHSPRFKVRMPILLGVRGFSGIRIHPGNDDTHTEGCILVGEALDDDRLLRSRLAYNALFAKLDDHLRTGGAVMIDVIEAWEA